ncbi:biotin transporter BioY, partial [Oenococcus oeni]|uniref:biotin transporter BioY n=1 Tax=Oenococcus oeni TaxID=1247 RepID=UPI000AB62BFE
AVIFGTTGGYIWGFLIYAFLVKFMLHNSKSTLKIGVANLTAATLQLFIGAAWLMFVAHLTPQAAIANGVLPFLVPGAIKIVAIVAVARLFAQRVPVLYR